MSLKDKATIGQNNDGHLQKYDLVEIDKIIPYANNAKKHPKWQINQIKDSIKQFGFISPIITDENYLIIAGHGRYEAAKLIGLKRVPIILVDNLSGAEVKAYRIADNQISMNTEHDPDVLRVELQGLAAEDLDFGLEVTGLSTGQLDIIIGGETPAENDHADDIPDVEDQPITQLGDLWNMGDHTLLCGNSLEETNYQKLMNGALADAVFSDPPYNCAISGHVCGNGKVQHDEFAMASGEMSDDEFLQFLIMIITLLIQFSKNGSLHYICMDWRNIELLLSAGRQSYHELKNICIWNKSNAGMGGHYRSKHEMIPVFKNGSEPHTNNIELGKHGRFRSNVWDYPGVNTFGRTGELAMHPTVKPTAMVADAIMDCTKRGEVVLDPFGGSGSTLIAAEMTGRCGRLIELEPKYCDVIIRRWQDFTGRDAIHARTGKTFNEIQNEKGE